MPTPSRTNGNQLKKKIGGDDTQHRNKAAEHELSFVKIDRNPAQAQKQPEEKREGSAYDKG